MKSINWKNTGQSPEAVRRHNLGLILGIMRGKKGITRSQLARLTHLAKPSISEIVNELIETRVVEELGEGVSSSKGGRKPIVLQIVPESIVSVGVDVRRNHISAVMMNLEGDILLQKKLIIHAADDTDKIIKIICSCISAIIELKKSDSILIGIGVGVPGPIDIKEGIILEPLNFKALHNVRLKEILQAKYHLPVFLELGAVAGATSEHFIRTLSGRNNANLAFIEIDMGIGLGMIANGNILHGLSITGAIGHMVIDPNGKECYCGRKGCLIQYVSGLALVKKLGLVQIDNNTSTHIVDEHTNYSQLLEHIIGEIKSGNKQYMSAVAEASEYLAIGIVNFFNLMSPHHLILGSSIPDFTELFWDNMLKSIKSVTTIEQNISDRIEQAHYGIDAIAAGGSTIVLSAFFQDPKGMLA